MAELRNVTEWLLSVLAVEWGMEVEELRDDLTAESNFFFPLEPPEAASGVDALLEALEPILIDDGVGAGREDWDRLHELTDTARSLLAEHEETG